MTISNEATPSSPGELGVAPLSMHATNSATASPMVLVVAAKGPYKTLNDVIKAARTEELAVGYSEGQTRLTGELIRQAGDLKMTGIPYKGGAPIMVDSAQRDFIAQCGLPADEFYADSFTSEADKH